MSDKKTCENCDILRECVILIMTGIRKNNCKIFRERIEKIVHRAEKEEILENIAYSLGEEAQ